MPRRLLVLGGTGEARELVEVLVRLGHHVITSMAGVTADALRPPGAFRAGGFGGTQGLVDFLHRERIDAVADATHPFAVAISTHACAAANSLGLQLVRLERRAWQPQAGDCWTSAVDYRQAAVALKPGAAVLLTVGSRRLEPFFARTDLSGVARMISVPDNAPPQRWLLLVARPPLRVATEMDLLRRHRITVAVTKNAGGEATAAKLSAARMLGLPVVMIERPCKPPALVVDTVDGAANLLAQKASPAA